MYKRDVESSKVVGKLLLVNRESRGRISNPINLIKDFTATYL